MEQVFDPSGVPGNGLGTEFDDAEECVDDPSTVVLQDIHADWLQANARPPDPDIAEPTLSHVLEPLTLPFARPPQSRRDLIAGLTMATGVALMMAVLVVVAIVGVVGGLGIGIAIAGVAG
ncbi:MAG: hypothetical protein AAGA48_22140 [Myxococcota bacterium]